MSSSSEKVKDYLNNPGKGVYYLTHLGVESVLFRYLLNSELLDLSKALYGAGISFHSF
jgi:hypothetical protein